MPAPWTDEAPLSGSPVATRGGGAVEPYRDSVRRLAGACLLAGALGAALAVHLGGLAVAEPRSALAAALVSVFSAAFVLTFPWARFHPDWFLLFAPLAVGFIAWASVLTGGAASPLDCLYYVVVALAAAYRGGLLLAGVVGLTGAAPLVAGSLAATGTATDSLSVTLFVRVPALAAVAYAVRVAASRGRREGIAHTPPDEPGGAIDEAILSSLSLDGVLDRLLATAAERLAVDRVALVLSGGRVFEAGAGGHRSGPVIELPVAIGGERLGTLRLVGRNCEAPGERQRAMARDIAAQAAVAIERARLLDRVFRATQELEVLFHVLGQGVAVADCDGRIVRVNRSFGMLLGLVPDAVTGRPVAEVLPGGAPPPLPHGEVIDPEARVSRVVEDPASGRLFELTTAPLFDPQLLLIGQVHVVRDITEERWLKEHAVQSEKLAALGQLVAGVAHELNNPIGIIMGHADLLAENGSLDEQGRDSAAAIAGQAERAARIVEQLLSFGRRSAPEKRPIDLNRLVTEIARLVEVDCRVARNGRAIRIALDLDPELPTVVADAHQLEQVFLNILTNARQAITSADVGGRIEISTSTRGRTVRVRVADDGPGIPAGILRRIFDPFFSTKQRGGGTGLGLAICYGIVEEHGGRIWAESPEGGGAAFTVELPLPDGDGR